LTPEKQAAYNLGGDGKQNHEKHPKAMESSASDVRQAMVVCGALCLSVLGNATNARAQEAAPDPLANV
jgi:hypothetical protein